MSEPIETTKDSQQSGSRLEQVATSVAGRRGVSRDEIDLVERHPASAPAAGHACPGSLTADTYWDTDGFEHIVIGTWYACESYWEINEDLTLLQ